MKYTQVSGLCSLLLLTQVQAPAVAFGNHDHNVIGNSLTDGLVLSAIAGISPKPTNRIFSDPVYRPK